MKGLTRPAAGGRLEEAGAAAALGHGGHRVPHGQRLGLCRDLAGARPCPICARCWATTLSTTRRPRGRRRCATAWCAWTARTVVIESTRQDAGLRRARLGPRTVAIWRQPRRYSVKLRRRRCTGRCTAVPFRSCLAAPVGEAFLRNLFVSLMFVSLLLAGCGGGGGTGRIRAVRAAARAAAQAVVPAAAQVVAAPDGVQRRQCHR